MLYSDGKELLQATSDILPVPNKQQEDALLQAVQQQFTIVHGAVATGKSQLAVKLAYMLCLRNGTQRNSAGQVLLCGSTESAVDVIMGELV